MTQTFNEMVSSCPSTPLLTLLPGSPSLFTPRASFNLSISIKFPLDTVFFSYHFFLWTSVIPQLVALYGTYQGHRLSPLIPKVPWETYMIISISLMRILCDAERLGNLYQSTVSLLFNYFVSLHALSLHQDYKHCVFKDLILCNSTWLIWYPGISFYHNCIFQMIVWFHYQTALCTNHV